MIFDPWHRFACTICGRSGVWPVVSYTEASTYVSERPSDCGAIYPLDNVPKHMLMLEPCFIRPDEVRYETACPICYRLNTTPSTNGHLVTAFPDVTRESSAYLRKADLSKLELAGTDLLDMLEQEIGKSYYGPNFKHEPRLGASTILHEFVCTIPVADDAYGELIPDMNVIISFYAPRDKREPIKTYSDLLALRWADQSTGRNLEMWDIDVPDCIRSLAARGAYTAINNVRARFLRMLDQAAN